MKFFPISLVAVALTLPALHAQLVVTEINSDGTPADFWELTNYGSQPVDLGNYRWIDSADNPLDAKAVVIPAGTVIAPEESIVFVVDGTAAAFRTAWNLAPSVQIITGGPGLGSNDAVNLYNAARQKVASLSYAAGKFRRSNNTLSTGGHAGISAGGAAGQSLILDPNFPPSSPRYTFATGGNLDTWAATAPNTGVGSPGKVGKPATNAAPVFVAPHQAFWDTGKPLGSSAFRITAVDPDAGQTLSFAVLSKPSWLTITTAGQGPWKLGGTPPQPGDYEFKVKVSDNFNPPATTEQTYTLTVFPAQAPILLNEYNAVGSSNYLNGGTQTADDSGVAPPASDSHFGRKAGNGGEWVEFVVVGNGAANNSVDMRGWKIAIHSAGTTSELVLTRDPYWQNVRAGTILTFIGQNAENGGMDSAIHQTSALHPAGGGFLWTNIWARDPVYVSQSESVMGEDLGIGSNDTRFTVFDASGTRVYGPAGEGIATADVTQPGTLGISSTEILRLQGTPKPTVTPLSNNYNDASTHSTFGAPNVWSAGTKTQDFSAFATANTPPRFTSTPPAQRHITTSYEYAIRSTDPNGNSVTLSAPELPGFLEFTTGGSGQATLKLKRPITLAEAGDYVIRILASDGQASTQQAWLVTAHAPDPTVIVNEYNAVAADRFLNGGTQSADDSGTPPPASDLHFGRVPGNGGPWFELVVTGNGGPSKVDLRGWTIEISANDSPQFLPRNRIRLSQDERWAQVDAGTILTFTAWNTAHGGLDTGILLRDQLATLGDVWSNIWLGDTELIDQQQSSGFNVGSGVVENIQVHNQGTQFRLLNAAGQQVFGPVGEGVAPLSGVSSTETFELQGNPSPSVAPTNAASGATPGYADSSSVSTFGLPNRWHIAGEPAVQDFSPYIAEEEQSGYTQWAQEHGLGGEDASPGADPDGDGRSNLAEYAFGGDPTRADSAHPQFVSRPSPSTTWTLAIRNDAQLNFTFEQSTELLSWSEMTSAQVTIQRQPHPDLPGFDRVQITIPSPVETGRLFFRARVEN